MNFRAHLCLALASFFLILSPSSRAQEDGQAQKENSPPVVKEENKSVGDSGKTAQGTPVTQWRAAEEALLKPLSQQDRESVFILINKHAMIRVVDVVKRDVGNAISACAKANADMKEKMEARFSQWKSSVEPIIDTARESLKQEIEKVSAVEPESLRHVIKLNDEAYAYGDKQTVKEPVSEKEACESLLESLDRTENQMVDLLKTTLLPESVIRSRVKNAPPVPEGDTDETQPEQTEPVKAE